MGRRLLDVTAYTTLEHVEGRTVGPDWEDGGVGVLDVDTPDEETDPIRLALEFDATEENPLEHHAHRVRLTTGQARVVANDLLAAARSSEAAEAAERNSGTDAARTAADDAVTVGGAETDDGAGTNDDGAETSDEAAGTEVTDRVP